jgi:hypothetical protein
MKRRSMLKWAELAGGVIGMMVTKVKNEESRPKNGGDEQPEALREDEVDVDHALHKD